jgi:hypothetical protein
MYVVISTGIIRLTIETDGPVMAKQLKRPDAGRNLGSQFYSFTGARKSTKHSDD